MSTLTATPVVVSTREDRLARQGAEAAQRTLADLRSRGLTGEDAVAFLTDAAERVEQGPAPEPFKTTYSATVETALDTGF